MAESFIQAAHSELTCPVCLELFVEPHNPKNMPGCAHVICEICLNQLAKGKKRSFKVKCPECRKSTKVSQSDIASLQTNLRLRNLAELAKQQPVHTPQVKTSPVTLCSQHDGEKMHYYCVPCKVLACQACLTLNHQGTEHTIQGAKERYLEKKQDMETIITKTNTKIEIWKTNVEQLKKVSNMIQELYANEEVKIDECVKLRIAEIRKQGQTLKGELQLVQQKHCEKIDVEINQFKSQIIKVENANAQSTEAISDYTFITQENLSSDQLQFIDNMNTPTNLTDSNSPHASAQFVEDTRPNVRIGRIVTQNRALELVQSFGKFKRAQSIASSKDGLLAVCDLDDQEVFVYHKEDGKYQLKFKLLLHILDSKHQWKVVNVHISSEGKILVARGKFLELYSSTGMYQKTLLTAHSPDTKVIVNSVTATFSGKIYAGDVHRSLITEHDSMGQVTRSIPTNIKPRFMVPIQETHIAMSDCESGKISIIERLSKKENLHLDLPEVNGICYDNKSDCILTVRNVLGDKPQRVKEGSGVIEQFCCKTGKLVAVMAEGLYHPTDLTFTPDGMLAIADHKTVKIYRVL